MHRTHKTRIALFVLTALLTLATALTALGAPPRTLDDLNISIAATRLDLGDVKVDDFDAFLTFLDKRPRLVKVDMFESRLKPEQIDLLAERYPHIAFGWTIRLVEDHYIRTDATAYAANHSNRSKLHSSEDFRQLKYCKDLQALDLGHNSLEDISFMRDLPKLKVIILANNFITDISPLADLKDLEYVELFNNYIEDYSPLAQLPKLMDLNIAFNQSQDFRPLYGLQGLERLWIYSANNRSSSDPVDPAKVEALQAALPDTLINSTSYSTLGGWRTHPRYYVVFNMLHGAVAWLPWDAEGLVPRYQ